MSLDQIKQEIFGYNFEPPFIPAEEGSREINTAKSGPKSKTSRSRRNMKHEDNSWFDKQSQGSRTARVPEKIGTPAEEGSVEQLITPDENEGGDASLEEAQLNKEFKGAFKTQLDAPFMKRQGSNTENFSQIMDS